MAEGSGRPVKDAADTAPLARFSAPTRAWFSASFPAATPAQTGAWAATADGGSALVSAPTGSGKTLAAFLAALDELLTAPRPEGTGTRVLYVSPLKALAYDVDRNLRAPLTGIRHAAERLGVQVAPVDVAIRTGDTPADERRRLARQPPDILITTPESLFLLLTSRARSTLAEVRTVIVDEVHAVAATKRGAHLALSLERLEALRPRGGPVEPLQRIGLSATQRPLDEVARFLAGGVLGRDGAWSRRPVTVVEAKGDKQLDVEIVVPVEDMSRLGEVLADPPTGPAAAAGGSSGAGLSDAGGSSGAGWSDTGESRRSIWPAVHPRILELIRGHRSTIVFANSRRLAERLCARLNELAGCEPDQPIARAHHGSVAREQRLDIEEQLKAGRLPCVVATSSLELGIDMGAVDLVVQVESPGSVASGLQRIGRAGHQVGAPSVGKVFPKYRGDLVECAVVVERMQRGEIEHTAYPRIPLDVLAQQVVAMAAMDPWPVDDLLSTLRGAASFADLSRHQLDGVLDMLSGRYPSDEFAELRPRVNWDRVEDRIAGRPAAQRLAVTSGGTIPDRGLYGVFLASDAGARVDGSSGAGGSFGAGRPSGAGGSTRGVSGYRRVGELDEEMVYETRPGETFTLGSTTWRIADITRDQVLVTPAPGEPGKLPFWHGDAPGRPIEVGRAVGAFLRTVADAADDYSVARLRDAYGLDELAAHNLVAYVAEQQEATGAVPSDRTVVVERFRDEIGDWRVCILSPFGARVHAPWALAIEARARERLGLEVQTIHADDGIVVRLPDADEGWAGSLLETLLVDPADVEDLVVGELANSALFAARFRECAARALLLPRRRGGSGGGIGRTPLWQQRQKAADLLAVASRYGQFPILLETYRECLRDVFDVPALVELLAAVESRRVRVVQVETPMASPFASSLLFDYVAGYLYEGDAPLAERRAHALSLDRELLAELLGTDELRELIDADALGQLELELQRVTPERHARSVDAVHDLLREIGDLRRDEIAVRTDAGDELDGWLASLAQQRRVYAARVAGEERWAAAEDAARLRDGLGVPVPVGLPEAFTQPVERPLVDLVARYARTHGPFHTDEVAARLGLPRDAVDLALAELVREGRVVAGAFRPGDGGRREWCDAQVLRRLKRRSLAALRREVEAVEPEALARLLPPWQGVGSRATGVDRVFEVIEQFQGAPIPASVLERDVLAARVRDYRPAWLDELAAGGEVVWVGRGPLGSADGRVSLYVRDQAPLLVPLPPVDPPEDAGPVRAALLAHLSKGAAFWPQLYAAAGGGAQVEVLEALWDLVWAGFVTNDTFGALRAVSGSPLPPGRGRRRPGRALARTGPPQAAGRWSLVADVTGSVVSRGSGGSVGSAVSMGSVGSAGSAVSPTERGAALAAQLLDRYGVVTRDGVAGEDLAGGFSAVYAVLRAMEEAGRCRRGYFVEGLGGAQFALPGAVDRLRSLREADEGGSVTVLAATDPANAYGAALPWPQPAAVDARPARHGPRRVAGASVVLHEGRLVAYVEKGGRSLLTFTDDEELLAVVAESLVSAVSDGRLSTLQLRSIDGEPPGGQPVVGHLRAAGFADHPRGLIRRR